MGAEFAWLLVPLLSTVRERPTLEFDPPSAHAGAAASRLAAARDLLALFSHYAHGGTRRLLRSPI